MSREQPERTRTVASHWQGRSQDPSLDDSQVTHPDVSQRWLEIEAITQYLEGDERALDVGCGAGFATKSFAPRVREIVGIDASAGMIARAQAPGEEAVPGNARFARHDVLDLRPEVFGLFDLAISVRCLINLPDWPTQQEALRRIAGVLRPGGRLILAEGSADGREGLNRLRERAGLERMPPVWHNRDFVRDEALPFLDELFRVVEERSFGVYDLVTRVAHPLLVAPAQPRYDAPLNEIAARISLETEGLPQLSRVLFLVLRRR